MRYDFDLAVVGGGPAGAAAALQASCLGLAVALYEPRTDEQDKPCGEGLLPAGVAALDRLGLGALVSRARRFDSLCYCIGTSPPLAVALPGPGYAVRRPELQTALNAALHREPGVVRFAEHAEATRAEKGFFVRAAQRLTARTLIAADGLGGGTAGWLRDAGWRSERTGVRARYRARRELDRVEVHLGPGCEVYLTPLPHGETNAAFLFERLPDGLRGAGALVDWALERHPAAAEHLGERTTRPAARRLDRRPPRTVARSGAFLAGDTGGGVDPVVGCGLTVALATGLAAGREAAAVTRSGSGAPERRYRQFYARETRLRRHLAGSLRRAAHHPRLLRILLRLVGRAPGLVAPLVRIAAGSPGN